MLSTIETRLIKILSLDKSKIANILNETTSVIRSYDNEGALVTYFNEELNTYIDWNDGKKHELVEKDKEMVRTYLAVISAILAYINKEIKRLNNKFGSENSKSKMLERSLAYITKTLEPFGPALLEVGEIMITLHSIAMVEESSSRFLDKHYAMNTFKELSLAIYKNDDWPKKPVFSQQDLHEKLIASRYSDLGDLVVILHDKGFMTSYAKNTEFYEGGLIKIEKDTTTVHSSKDDNSTSNAIVKKDISTKQENYYIRKEDERTSNNSKCFLQ